MILADNLDEYNISDEFVFRPVELLTLELLAL